MASERHVPEVFTGARWLFMVKPFQIKPCELLQPCVPTLSSVGGALATSWNYSSQTLRARRHIIVISASFSSFLVVPVRIKRGKCNLETVVVEINTQQQRLKSK